MSPRPSRLPALLASLLLFSSAPAFGLGETPPAASQPDDAELDRLAQAGLRGLYNFDYEGARGAFSRIAERYPDSPLGAYAVATALWWELTNEYDERNPALEKSFLAAVDRAISLSRRRIKTGDPDGLAHLCLGGSLGLRSRWDVIQGRWFRAYLDGKQAFQAQEKAVEINPRLYDAYLGVGIFHYYTAALPKAIKILAKFVFGGNKEQGLREIRLAMEKGRYSRTAAQLFLVGIYNNAEKDPKTALALVREGRREYPQSPFFHLLELLTLEPAGDAAGLRREAQDFIDRVERGEPLYSRKYLHRGYFSLANSYLIDGQPGEAARIYDRILAEFPYEDRWISLTHLNRGRARDLLGRREEALQDYRAVLKRRDVWQLHDEARKSIDKPYRRPGP